MRVNSFEHLADLIVINPYIISARVFLCFLSISLVDICGQRNCQLVYVQDFLNIVMSMMTMSGLGLVMHRSAWMVPLPVADRPTQLIHIGISMSTYMYQRHSRAICYSACGFPTRQITENFVQQFP